MVQQLDVPFSAVEPTTKMTSTTGMFALGAFVRFWLATSDYQKVIADRVEVSTPVNSWKRVTEGLHLLKLDVPFYSGDALHEPPLHLLAYSILVSNFKERLYIVFIVCDIATAYFLYLAAKGYMVHLRNAQKENKERFAKGILDVLKNDGEFSAAPLYVAAAYLCNPYIVFNCVGFTTTVFGNFFMALFLAGLTHCNFLLSTLSLAVGITQNLYSILLISPLFFQFLKVNKPITAVCAVITTLSFWFALMCWSCQIHGNWNFLADTYGFILSVPDLRPNIGLFWYFFTEMFGHFHYLFLYSFHINGILLYLIPLSIRFRCDPMLLATSLLLLTATFKSYPSLGDVGFALALVPCWTYLFNYMKQGLVVGCSFLVTTVLAPIFWYLWIYSGSANANFYFGVTLAFAATQIFLVIDLLLAYITHEFTLLHGCARKVDGVDAQLKLE